MSKTTSLVDQHQTLLGFDFGTRSIGVAIGQTITYSASPLGAITAKAGQPQWQDIDKLVRAWQPQALVVGIPLTLSGEDFPVTPAARAFAATLKTRYPLPVYGVDEQLTTRSACEALFEQGGYRALQKTQIDSLSAKIILETWFSRSLEQITVF